MSKRTVGIGLASYLRADSPADAKVWGFGLYGEEVDVHGDDLERFDRLNGPAPTPAPDLLLSDEPDESDIPAGNASLEAWQDYARTRGATDADLEGLSRNDLRDAYGN